MDVQVRTENGLSSETTLTVSDEAFDRTFNESLVHQVVVAYLAGGRAGTKANKSRADVRGGSAKPWRQKGTGRARAGTIRSPLWRGGGVTFAASPRDHTKKVNRKMYRAAMRCIVSELLRQDRLVVVERLALDDAKTRLLSARLAELGVTRGLLVLEEPDRNIELASGNLPHIEVASASNVDPVSLVRSDRIVISAAALKRLEERLA